MKILIVSQYYYPEQFQINEIAPELVRRGHDVTVLTGLPNYPKGETYPGYGVGEENINGVRVIRTKLHPRKSGALHLGWNYISFVYHAGKAAKKLQEKYDIVLAYQLSPVTVIQPAIVYKKKYSIPLLVYCLDIWPESAQAHVKSDKGLLYSYISKLSMKLYQQCDHIAVTSRPFIDYHRRVNHIHPDKMSYLPQHADDTYLTMDLTAPDNGIADFMYAGNLGQGQRVDVILKAAAEIREKQFVLHIVGDGSVRQELENLCDELGLKEKTFFYGNQKREDMPDFYKKADALLITLRGNNFVGNTMPGKLQTYMTCGKPIFGAINGAAMETIELAQCGTCVEAENHVGLARIMSDFIEHPENYTACGRNARVYFQKHFTLNQHIKLLEKTMEEMTK